MIKKSALALISVLALGLPAFAQQQSFQSVQKNVNAVVQNGSIDLRQALNLTDANLMVRQVEIRFETRTGVAFSLVSNNQVLAQSQLSPEFGYTSLSASRGYWNIGTGSLVLHANGDVRISAIKVTLNQLQPAPIPNPNLPGDLTVTIETNPNERVEGSVKWTYLMGQNYTQYDGYTIKTIEVTAAPLYLNVTPELRVAYGQFGGSFYVNANTTYTLTPNAPLYFNSRTGLDLHLSSIYIGKIKFTMGRP
jgi:hypothetical protein